MLVLACFISVSFYLPAVLADEILPKDIVVEDIEIIDFEDPVYTIASGGKLYNFIKRKNDTEFVEALENDLRRLEENGLEKTTYYSRYGQTEKKILGRNVVSRRAGNSEKTFRGKRRRTC